MEILQVCDTVAREKGIDKEVVIEAMEEAIQKAGRSKYGFEHDIRAIVDRKSGNIDLYRFREVVEEVEEAPRQLTLKEAKAIDPEVELGGFVKDKLPPLDFGRIAAMTAKQVITQKVREAERDRQFNEFKDRVGEIINGVVKRVEYGNVTVDLGKAEAILRRDEGIPREHLKTGERIRAYIYDVRRENRGPQIFLSRTHPQFLAKLFTQEVPEIYDGIIEIRSVARDPGSRAKIAVLSNDPGIDPVGACVGMRGSRVQAVVAELQGEKIDIIPWTGEMAPFVINAIAPAEVSKVVFDEDKNKIEVVVPDDQLSLAIGRRGQNVRLASNLIGWDIDIMTEEQESERRQAEIKERSELFMEALDVDDVLAHLLVAEGFTMVEELRDEELSELVKIEGFEEEIAQELQNRAATFIEKRDAELTKKYKDLGTQDDLVEMGLFTPEMLVKLAEDDVKSRKDLAYLSGDELVEILGRKTVGLEQANEIVMAERVNAGLISEEDLANDEQEALDENAA
ncbi:MAG: transcription termination/antitermination protein NusA [Rickettsiales bacterium]|nr:transcription termination/antitermination protein NusA [Rickettsiales bacterium]|tara:strand:+ start:179 stop:1711 length:1533 start_codon:yes stop_codon:yes gene_type:complete